MASMLRLLWCVCLFVAGGSTWASQPDEPRSIEDEVAEIMAQAIASSLGMAEEADVPVSTLPNLMIYILGQHLDGYFPFGMHKEQLVKNIFYQHLDTGKGFTIVNSDFLAGDDDEFIDVISTPVVGPPSISFVSRLMYFFAGIIPHDRHGLVRKNLVRISWLNEGHQCFTFRFLRPRFRDDYVNIISGEMGPSWLTGFVQDKAFPTSVFDYHELMRGPNYDQAIWQYYYKGEEVCEPMVGLTQATELLLFLKEHYVIPHLGLFQQGKDKDSLHKISFTINNHFRDDQTFFVSQFVRYNLAFISQSLTKCTNSMSQFAGVDFVGSTSVKITTNFYFPDFVEPEDAVFEIRQLFFKIGLKFKYDMPDELYAFRPAMFSVGQKSKIIARPVQYGSFVTEYLNAWPSLSHSALKTPIVLDFQYVDSEKTSAHGLFVAKVTFKLAPKQHRFQFFAMIYETLGTINMEQMKNLNLKEFRLVPLKSDEFTLYVSISRVADDASLQIALVQEVLTLILRSVGIQNEVFIGTMTDMTKKFNLVKSVTALSKEMRAESAIDFNIETKADREAIRMEAEKRQLEAEKKDEARRKNRSFPPQPAQKSLRQLMKESSRKDKKKRSLQTSSESAQHASELQVKEEAEAVKIAENVEEANEAKEAEAREVKEVQVKEEELFVPKTVPVKAKKTKVKASKRRRQEMLQAGQLKRNKPTSSSSSTSPTGDQEESSLQAQIEAIVAEMRPVESAESKPKSAVQAGSATSSTGSGEKSLTPLERARGKNESTKKSSGNVASGQVVQPVCPEKESILHWFQYKEQPCAASSGPIIGPVIGAAPNAEIRKEVQGPLVGPAIRPIVGPVVEPTPEKEAELSKASTTTTSTSSTSGSPTSAPLKTPGLSASAAEFVPSSSTITKGPVSTSSSAVPEFYNSPRVIVTSAGEPLSQGHHVGFWASYLGFNLWSNPAWTKFQAVHIVRRTLGLKPPTERYASLVFGLADDGTAGLCLNQAVSWVTLNADYYVKTRTVAVSLIGAAHSVWGNSTVLVFTLRFPDDDDDFSAYKSFMARYSEDAKFVCKVYCPLSEPAINESVNPTARKESWEFVQKFPQGNLVHSQFSSLYTAGSLLKQFNSAVFSNMFYLGRIDPPKANSMAEPQHQIIIESENVHALYEVLLSMLETLVEDSWTGRHRKYPFLEHANYIYIKPSKTRGRASELIIQLDPDAPEETVIDGQRLSKYMSTGLGQFGVIGVRGDSKLLPFYTLHGVERQATRQLYNSNMHAYNTREILTNVAMTIRFMESQETAQDLESWFTVQHLVCPDNLETIERLLNELCSLPRHGGLAQPRAFWHRKINASQYVVGVAFLDQPVEDLLRALVEALCIYSGLHPNDYSEAFTETSIPLVHAWQFDRLVDKAMSAYIIPEPEQTVPDELVAEEGAPKDIPMSSEDVPQIPAGVIMEPPVRRVMPKEYVPVIPSTTFTATPAFSHSQTQWHFRYQVDNSTPISQLKLRIPASCTGQFYAYLEALTDQLPGDYWRKGYGLMVERLYADHSVYECLGDEPDAVFELAVTGGSRSGDVLRVLIKLLSAVVMNKIPVDKLVIVSLADASDAKIVIVALPTITVGQVALLKREAGSSAKWTQKWD